MDRDGEELTPSQLIKHAKKHPHTHNISTEAFSVAGKDFVVHNLSMKGDPDNDFDIANYRRGLAIIEEIINFKEGPPRFAKKGLRKFTDLLPEYLDNKKSHLSTSKHHLACKRRILGAVEFSKAEQFTIYSSEKANGENAQITWDGDGGFWVIGSKNKTLLLSEEKDTKYITNKFQHVRTLAIANLWFRILETVPEKVQQIKEKLTHQTLVGEICDSIKSGHIVDYGTEPKLFFYALVQKDQHIYSCQPPSQLLTFLKQVNLENYSVKFKITKAKTYQALHEELKKEVSQIFEAPLEQAGEGTVLYITTGSTPEEQICESVCKVKTLEYRIYRKLREKLKVFFEKVRKSYQKNLNKFIEEVKQLVRNFDTPKPLEYYYKIAARAFEFCENQQKAVLKFISNKFISFLKLLQNQKVDKQSFLAAVHDSSMIDQLVQKQEGSDLAEKQTEKTKNQMGGQQKIQLKNKQIGKQVLVLVPMTIPSTGKSSVFRIVKEKTPELGIYMLSSDTVREEVMKEKMKRQKSLTKKAAFQKSRKQANERYYRYMGDIFRKMAKEDEHPNMVLLLDKNHPENALKTTIEEIRSKSSKHPQLKIKIVGALPLCKVLLQQKPKYMYPFSSCYIATCMKRVLSRQQHETLEGSEEERANICICFANMFRNFALSPYNLTKHFDGRIDLPFTNEQELPKEIQSDIITILRSSKPGMFEPHESLGQLLAKLKAWNCEQNNLMESAEYTRKTLLSLFDRFQDIKVEIDSE